MNVSSEVAQKVQEIMSSREFIDNAVLSAVESEKFLDAVKNVMTDAMDGQDVVVVINEAAEPANRGGSIITVENGVKILAVVGVAATVYVGFSYGAKMVGKFRK